MRIAAKWLISIAAVWLVSVMFPEVVILSGTWQPIMAAGTILFLINLIIRPIIQVMALPVTCLTLGVGAVLVNTLMVKLTDLLLPIIDFGSFWTLLLTALLVSVGTVVFDSVRK